MVKKFGRTTNYVYYDVTNFFFETDEPDEGGLRRCGVSKEHRKTPIVQMGLLMDEQGIPVSVEAFPGNTLDHQTLQQSFDSADSCLKNSRYIYVCDKGIGRGDNFGYAVASGNGYLTSKSVRSSSKAEKRWILDPEGYMSVGQDFKYKSKVIVRDISMPDGTKITVSEKVLTYWSRQYFEREKAEKQSFYDTVERLLAAPESFRVTKTQYSYFKKYLKKDVVNAVTGEAVDAAQLMAVLDMDKIKAEYDLLGYYTLVTSETRMEDRAIIDTYKNLVEIEDQFRVMKSTLETRPVYVRTAEHITAHLAVCAIALIMLRLIQRQVKLMHPETVTGNVFSVGMSADRIQTALCRWQVEKLDDVYYRFCNLRDPDLKLILDSFGLHIPLKCFQIGEIKHLKQLMFLSM